MQWSQSKNHEDHIEGRGMSAWSYNNLVHNFVPLPQAMKIPEAETVVEKEREKIRNTGMAADESQKTKMR